MNHSPKFAADSLHKEYPEPEDLPEDGVLRVIIRGNGIVTKTESPRTIFFRESPETFGFTVIRSQYLGHLGAEPCYGIEIAVDNPIPEGWSCTGVRELSGIVSGEEFAIAGLAGQILDYDRTTRFCGRCGKETRPLKTERAKLCPSCGLTTYARLSPAIIVLVRKGDSILLARSGNAPPGWYSVVAGFVEPGETIEHAVHREVLEETGIRITNLRYITSEPWPFPNSLMLGFVADYAGGEIVPDKTEIEAAGWFGKDNLPDLPPRLSISRSLIDGWLHDEY